MQNTDTRRQAQPMLGDVVRPRPYSRVTRQHGHVLASGCSRYDDAIVVRVEPFALVSRAGDMIWSCTVARSDFEVTGRASFEVFDACRERLTYGLTNRRIKRERSKARRRLAKGHNQAQPVTEPSECGRCSLPLHGYEAPDDCRMCDPLCPIWGTHGDMWNGDEESSRAAYMSAPKAEPMSDRELVRRLLVDEGAIS